MTSRPWWRDAVVYQVYPRTFHDSDGNGIGDLRGVIARLDYLNLLGVDAIWLTPFYPSPQHDGGYDISDPRAVDPQMGTMADFDELVAQAGQRGIRVMVDVVPNHVSQEHPWFQAARNAARNAPERALFHFADGTAGGPPNNWISVFGGSAWTQVVDEHGLPGQWYLHLFDASQPDLNWSHPQVQDDALETLRFWLDHGAAGVRVDVALALAKDMTYMSRPNPQALVDAIRLDLYDPANPEASDEVRSAMIGSPFFDRDEVHDYYKQWRGVLDDYGAFAIAEAWAYPADRAAAYAQSLGQVFCFDFLVAPFDAQVLSTTIARLMNAAISVGTSPTWVLGNHDVARVVTRYGGGSEGLAQARAMAMLAAFLPGSFYVYQGDELGLPDAYIEPSKRRDPIWRRSGNTDPGRDGARAPLPWDASSINYGYSSAPADNLWLPQPRTWAGLAASTQVLDPDSTLNLYRDMLTLRRNHPAWHSHTIAIAAHDGVLRVDRGSLRLLVNTTDEVAPLAEGGEVVLRSRNDVPWPAGVLPENAAVLIDHHGVI